MAEFSYKSLTQGGLLTIQGRFTVQDKDTFTALFKDQVDLSQGPLYIDAAGLAYIDSSAIGDLLKVKMEATKHNKKVHIAGLSEQVLKIFKMACLDSVFVMMTDSEFDKATKA